MLRFFRLGLVAFFGLLSTQAVAGSSKWIPLKGRHRKVSVSRVKRKMRSDGLKQPGNLLAHKYLLRLEVKGAGGGPSIHSEIVVRLRAKPALALAKGSTGDRAPNRAQLGGWKTCKIPKANGPIKSVGRTCPAQYNGRGFVDVTSNITERNLLLVFDPPKRGTGAAVLWIASDVPQTPMWYYVMPGARGVRFGGGRVRVQRFQIDVAPAGEPSVPPAPDAGGAPRDHVNLAQPADRPAPRPAPRPAARPAPRPAPRPRSGGEVVSPFGSGNAGGGNPQLVSPPARKVRPHRGGFSATKPEARAPDGGLFVRQVRRDRALVGRRLVADGVPRYEVLLRAKRLVRVAVRDPGAGHDIAMLLAFPGRPRTIFGNSWGMGHLGGAQAGDEARCRAVGGQGAYACPVRFNGLGWRNLTGLITGPKMVLVHRGPAGASSGMILWIALSNNSGRVSYRVLRGLGGKVRIKDFLLVSQVPPAGDQGRRPAPGVVNPFARFRNWRRVTNRPISSNPWQIQRIMRRDGLVAGAMLARFPYVVRVKLVGAGGGTGVRTEVGLRFAKGIAAAVGRGWANGREPGRAQVGAMAMCRTGLYQNLPKGWRTCPLQFSNLGWRNLTQGLRRAKKILLISQPASPRQGGMTLYLAFNQNPWPVFSRVFRRAGRYTLGRGRLSVQVFALRAARPVAPTQPPVTQPPPGELPPDEGPGPEGEGYPGPDAPPPDDGPTW